MGSLTVLALTLTACGGGALPPVPHVKRPIALVGFNDNSVGQGLVSPGSDARLLSESGANAVRVTLDWAAVEKAPGRFDFGFADSIYTAMRTRKVRVLWIPMFAPGWAAAPGCPPRPVVCHAPPSRSHDRDWSELIARIARRYPGSAGIEIWNEPNYVAFWMPRPDPARYAELLSEAYAAVKRAHPSMPVVSGGLGDAAPHVDGDISLEAFAQGLLRAGAITHIDAFGVHAYPLGSDEGPFLSSLAAIRRLRSRYGRPTLPLWITEVGVSTTGPGAVTAADQARELVDLFRRAEAMSDVQALFVHTLLEPPGAADNPEVGFGVLHTDGSPKPAAAVLNRLLREQRRLRSENQAPR